VEHLTEGIARLVAEHQPGIHHIAGGEWLNMYQFATAVATAFRLDGQLITPTQADIGWPSPQGVEGDLPGDPSADLLGLDCRQTMARLGLRAPSMKEGLAAMLVHPGQPLG
jgi:dTDP-4-dehydrorhamnose reductase